MSTDLFDTPRAILAEAVRARAFPTAVIEVGTHERPWWREAFGALTYEPDSLPARDTTVFDLASLTKVVASATFAMGLVEADRIQLDDLVSHWLSDWRGDDRATVTIRDLLAHTSGLTAYLPFFRDYSGRAEFQRAICSLPLEYPPRTQSLYSDLGFILLGFILADAAGASLSSQLDRLANLVAPEPLAFNPPREWRGRTAPTEVDPWRGRLLVGEVHDENAWALGGAAGHAGLFGTAGSVGRFAQMMLRTLGGSETLTRTETLRTFVTPVEVPGSSRALAWDTMRRTSSCGHFMSEQAIGHTGFTGTSLWIDPAADAYVVLLTNRVYPSRSNEAIREVRVALHDAVMKELDSLNH